jgi:hypothetical protein
MALDFFFASGGPTGEDGELRRRKLFAGEEEEVLPRLPFTGSMPSGAGASQDDGLGGGYLYNVITTLNIRNPSDPNDDIRYETISERINLFYLFGGVRDSGAGGYLAYNTLYLDYHYREVALINGVVVGRKDTYLGAPRLIEKYTPGGLDLPSATQPAITGAAFLGGRPFYPGSRSIGLYGVQDMGVGPGGSQIVDLRTDYNWRTADMASPIMDFRVPLQGALAASRERGSLFTVAELPATDSSPLARAILEFDPRNNYLMNSWSTIANDLAILSEQVVNGAGQAVHAFGDPGYRAKGAAFVQGNLVVAFDRDPTRDAETADAGPQYFTFDPAAANTASDPGIVRVDTGVPGSTALTELVNESLALPAMRTLRAPGGPIDTSSINVLFSRLAYSQQSLDSGVVRRVFEHHFQQTAINPSGCTSGNPVFDQIPSKLAQFVDTQSGFGRVAHELRNPGGTPLTSDYACAAPDAPAPVTPPR